jgi:RNA polymerase sigma-70 factor (ECF subfamily)
VWMERIHTTVPGPPEDDAEAEVLEALSRGDRKQALTQLMGLYGTAIFNYCRHMLKDATLADDVHQTTFAQAYADLARYGGKSTLRVWLYGIARHRCLDSIKMNARRDRVIEPWETLPDAESPELTAEQRAILASHGKRLATCLDHLPDATRDAILQRFMEQLSYEEMATLTGERAATLQMRVARAMPVLRKCLESSGVTG